MMLLARGRKWGKPACGGWTIPAPGPPPTPFAAVADEEPNALPPLAMSIASAAPPRRRPTLPKNCRRVVRSCCSKRGSISVSWIEPQRAQRAQRAQRRTKCGSERDSLQALLEAADVEVNQQGQAEAGDSHV